MTGVFPKILETYFVGFPSRMALFGVLGDTPIDLLFDIAVEDWRAQSIQETTAILNMVTLLMNKQYCL